MNVLLDPYLTINQISEYMTRMNVKLQNIFSFIEHVDANTGLELD